MGLFTRIKEAGGYVFNFRVSKWFMLDEFKQTSSKLFSIGRSMVLPEQAEYSETFEEALQRLNITEEQIQQRKIEFTRLMIIFLVVAALIFAYSIFIVVVYKNLFGFCIGFAITIFALTQAFRYHFWIFQIRTRKLGCTLRDWFLDIK